MIYSERLNYNVECYVKFICLKDGRCNCNQCVLAFLWIPQIQYSMSSVKKDCWALMDCNRLFHPIAGSVYPWAASSSRALKSKYSINVKKGVARKRYCYILNSIGKCKIYTYCKLYKLFRCRTWSQIMKLMHMVNCNWPTMDYPTMLTFKYYKMGNPVKKYRSKFSQVSTKYIWLKYMWERLPSYLIFISCCTRISQTKKL